MCDFFSGCQIENPILSIKYGMKESRWKKKRNVMKGSDDLSINL